MKNALISFGHPKVKFKRVKWLAVTPPMDGDLASHYYYSLNLLYAVYVEVLC